VTKQLGAFLLLIYRGVWLDRERGLNG